MLHVAVDFQLDGLLLEWEEPLQQQPRDNKEHQHQGNHEHHPVAEADVHVHACGVVQNLVGESVRRCADRRSHATKVGADRNGHGEGNAALAVGGKRLEDRRKERQHHGCSGGIGDEHGENTRDEQETQQHILAALAKWTNQGLGHPYVETRLGGRNGEDETAKEQDDCGVGKASHDTHRVEQLAILALSALHERERGVADEEQQHENDGHRRGPRWNGLSDPKQHCHDEDGNDALMNNCQTFNSKTTGG